MSKANRLKQRPKKEKLWKDKEKGFYPQKKKPHNIYKQFVKKNRVTGKNNLKQYQLIPIFTMSEDWEKVKDNYWRRLRPVYVGKENHFKSNSDSHIEMQYEFVIGKDPWEITSYKTIKHNL